MKQYGRTINLKDDPKIVERYLEHHRAIWPEVERGLKSIGIAFDPDRDFPRYEASNPRNREWQELMASMQEQVPGAKPGEWWAEMKLVFSL